PVSAARAEQLGRLARPGTIAVITGQQVGLFLGPLYTFYKAASAVLTARALEQESGVPCVPVFWLQTEDHDFAEIAHCEVVDRNCQRVRVELPERLDQRAARISVAQRRLGEDIAAPLEQLATALDGLPHASEVMDVLRAHYRPERGLAEAFTHLLAALFSETGLLLFDPRDRAVAELTTEVYRTTLLRHDEVAQRLVERAAALERAGFDVQVPVARERSLVFFHEPDAVGPRFR